MPFISQNQRAWMYINKPDMAKRWEKETPKGKKLPKKVNKKEDGGFSTLGYKNNSPDKDNAYNIISSGDITMKDVDFPVVGMSLNTGEKRIMYPNENHRFSKTSKVLEIPIKQQGGYGIIPKDPLDTNLDNVKAPILNGLKPLQFQPQQKAIKEPDNLSFLPLFTNSIAQALATKVSNNRERQYEMNNLANPLNYIPQTNNTNNYINYGTPSYQEGGFKKLYNPKLSETDDKFKAWYFKNTLEGQRGVPYSDKMDYDYYSWFRNKEAIGDIENHFPDTYKKPKHPTFSNESLYSTPEYPGGYWEGEVYHKKGKFQKFQEGGILEEDDDYEDFQDDELILQQEEESLPQDTIIHDPTEIISEPEDEIIELSDEDYQTPGLLENNSEDVEFIPNYTPIDMGANLNRVMGRMPASGNSNKREQEATSYLVQKGLPDHIAAGIVGNLIQESNLNPNAVQQGGNGRGLAQWDVRDRFQSLKQFASSQGRPHNDLYTQLDFLIEEARGRGDLGKIQSAKSPTEAAYLFAKHFERPKRIEDIRMKNAERIFKNRS